MNLIARSATKIGTDAFAIAATPESMCFSPQAISVNGSAPLIDPEDESLAPGAAHAGERRPDALPADEKGESSAPPISRRSSIKKRRREVADADLDEEIRGAPDRGEEEQERARTGRVISAES